MTACFYNLSGNVVGIDTHVFWKMVKGAGWPGMLIGIPKNTRHLVGAGFCDPNNGKFTPTVTSDGEVMLTKDYSLKYVPHLPITTSLPSALGIAWLLSVIGFSKSEPFMFMTTVTGEGTPLACCLDGMVGLNVNCDGYGVVINPNSVVTSPSTADFARAVLGFLADKVIDWAVGKAIGYPGFTGLGAGGVKVRIPDPRAELLKWAFDQYVKKPYVDPFVESQIEQVVDDL